MKKVILIIMTLILFSSNLLYSQSTPPTNLTGIELRTWLKNNWYTGYHNQLGYNSAREQMYGYIDKKNDGQVYCVYTGFHQTASYTTYLNPINAEHSIPQSWFSEAEPMKSDLFHLYPTHQDVNSARGNYPFAELADNTVNKWYIVNSNNTGLTISTSIPTSNIDLYSEFKTNTAFEPREDHKGDLARAAFYFYTMYNVGGGITDLCNLATLYQWHQNDPVDSWELTRNARIYEKQGNKNPYITHPEIVCRAWMGCGPDAINEITNISSFIVFPNPVKNNITINYTLTTTSDILVELFDITGKKIMDLEKNFHCQGDYSINTEIGNNLQSGYYFIKLSTNYGFITQKLVIVKN